MATLIDNIDSLLADLNDTIFEMEEQRTAEIYKNSLLKLNSLHHFDTPSTPTSIGSDLDYVTPIDKNFLTISALPNAFASNLGIVYYKGLFNTSRKVQDRFIVVTSHAFYIFEKSAPQSEFLEEYPINKKSDCRISNKKGNGDLCLEFFSEYITYKVILEPEIIGGDEVKSQKPVSTNYGALSVVPTTTVSIASFDFNKWSKKEKDGKKKDISPQCLNDNLMSVPALKTDISLLMTPMEPAMENSVVCLTHHSTGLSIFEAKANSHHMALKIFATLFYSYDHRNLITVKVDGVNLPEDVVNNVSYAIAEQFLYV
ncbi:hypothetical protein HK099_002907 [Clydaea vesicula]|uniref:Uncharacterized protein n=1 Tax=Clydaea vesicula TaxID=447962 RepID=A0AAD5U9K4_9FUNG|nr:hypothetical protein HK099_002907 [Clydaea vesicula]